MYRFFTALAFVVVVLLVFCPVLIIAPSLPLRRAIGRAAVRAWLLIIGVRFRVRGLHHLPDGPCIALCNHASYVDGIILTAALPGRFSFLVQHGAAQWPYIGLIIRRMGVAFVNRESVPHAATAVRRLIRATRAGDSWAMFPEGTFRQAPGLMPFRDGAFFIAAKTNIPVVPGVMHGSRRFFGDGQYLPRWSRIDVEFFPPITPTGPSRADAKTLRNTARAVMVDHCDEGDGASYPRADGRKP